jgi:hypothetical protein
MKLFENGFEKSVHFTDGDDDGDLELSAGSYKLESVPFSRAGERKELLEGLLSDVDGTSRPVSIVLDEEEIVSQVVFGSGIGLALEEFRPLGLLLSAILVKTGKNFAMIFLLSPLPVRTSLPNLLRTV